MGRNILVALVVALLVALGSNSLVFAGRAFSSGNVDSLPAGGKVCALVVGISDYAPVGPGGPDLAFADDDADAVVTALTTVYGVPLGNITLLKDSAATRSAILVGLNTAKNCTGPDDDLFVFLSGHGTIRVGFPDGDAETKDNAFLTHEGGMLGVILDTELASISSSDNARRRIVLGDYSFPSGFNNDMRAAGNILYVAAARGEEFEAAGHGVFTWKFIVRGIIEGRADDPAQNPHGNGDGKVTMEEAADFAVHDQFGITGVKPSVVDPDKTKDVHPAS